MIDLEELTRKTLQRMYAQAFSPKAEFLTLFCAFNQVRGDTILALLEREYKSVPHEKANSDSSNHGSSNSIAITSLDLAQMAFKRPRKNRPDSPRQKRDDTLIDIFTSQLATVRELRKYDVTELAAARERISAWVAAANKMPPDMRKLLDEADPELKKAYGAAKETPVFSKTDHSG